MGINDKTINLRRDLTSLLSTTSSKALRKSVPNAFSRMIVGLTVL
jgi:hypothetical protein